MVGRVLQKLSREGHISLLTFPGRHGSVIYLQNYLSTMFQISDVMIDKEEVAMSLNIAMPVNADASSQKQGDAAIAGFINCVPNSSVIVSKPDIDCIAPKVMQQPADLLS